MKQVGTNASNDEVKHMLLDEIVDYDQTKQKHVLKALPKSVVSLTDAASIAIDASLGNEFYLVFTSAIGNTRAMANPTNLLDQRLYLFIFDQDVAGGRSINSWGNKFRFSGGTTPTFTATGSKRDIMLFRYDATKDKLDHLATQTSL